MAITITVNAVDRTSYGKIDSCVIEDRLAGRGQMRLTLIDRSASPTYRPNLLETITLMDGATTMFGGYITAIDETPVIHPARGIRSEIVASDNNFLADRPGVLATYAASRGDKSIKYIISDIRTTYLAQFSVTLDPLMATGPDIDGEVVFSYVSATEAFNHLCTLAGWIWYIDYAKVLHAHAPGDEATPVTLLSSNATANAGSWRQELGQYRNKQYVKWTGGVVLSQDAVEQAARGNVVKTVENRDITDETSAQTFADGLIRQYANLPKVARIVTYESGFAAGQQGTITIPERNISGTWLCQAVTKTYQPVGDSAYQWRTEIEAVEGDELAGSWIDAWRAVLGGGSSASSGGGISGGSVASSSAGPAVIFLGGSRQFDIANSGTNDAIDYIPLYVSSAALAAKSCTVRCQVRTTNAGTTVQPQLWDDTAAASAGTGSATASTTWEDQSFGVTLTLGHTYHFQLIASGTAGVLGIAVLHAI